MTTADLRIEPLTPDRLPDLAALFEQGGDPKLVLVHLLPGPRPSTAPRATQGSATAELDGGGRRRSNAGDGRAPGLVAYRERSRRSAG